MKAKARGTLRRQKSFCPNISVVNAVFEHGLQSKRSRYGRYGGDADLPEAASGQRKIS